MLRDFLIIFYIVGIIGLNLELTRSLFTSLIPFTILLSFTILMIFHQPWNWKFIFASLVVSLAGFIIEGIGVHTNLIFGEYTYGPNLGLKIWDTPLLIGLNWLMLVYIAYCFFHSWKWHVVLKIIIGATVLVIYDLFMEPIAIQLDMWSWAAVTVPLKNYIAWFLLSVIFLSFFYLLKVKVKNRMAGMVFFVQLGFFIILNLIRWFI